MGGVFAREDRDKKRIIIAKMLFAKGAKAFVDDWCNGYIPFLEASQKGYYELVELFLVNGVTVDLQDKSGWTALMHAVDGRSGDTMKVLLAGGVDPNKINNDGKTALDIAKSLDYKEGIYILEDYLKERDKWKEAVEDASFINELLNEPFDHLRDFLDRNAQRTKEFVERIIKSDFPDKVKEQAGRLLEVINSGTRSINPRYVTDLVNNVIQYGGIPYLSCVAIATGVGALLLNGVGGYAGFEFGHPICLAILGTGTAAGFAEASQNYFREGSGDGSGKSEGKSQGGERKINPSKAESKVWQELKPYKKGMKTNSLRLQLLFLG